MPRRAVATHDEAVRQAEYAARVRAMDRRRLLRLWAEICDGDGGKVGGWPAGIAFEYLVVRAFELEGAEVRYPFAVRWNLGDEDGDSIIEQIDGAIHVDGLDCLVESKDRGRAESVVGLAKLRNQLLRRSAATIGLYFSRSGYTDAARRLTRFMAPQTILLWDGSAEGGEVEACLRKARFREGLRLKYRDFVETGTPDYNPRERWEVRP